MLYEDPERRIDNVLDEATRRTADIHIRDEYGVEHMMWTLLDRETCRFIQSQMAEQEADYCRRPSSL